MTYFDPTKNLIQYTFLNECDKNSLRNWPWGWEFYSFRQGKWMSLDKAAWCEDVVYRGKPKPVVTSVWHNVYSGGPKVCGRSTRKCADDFANGERIAVLRIDTCNGVSTAHLEDV
jgi:hypothetical protein